MPDQLVKDRSGTVYSVPDTQYENSIALGYSPATEEELVAQEHADNYGSNEQQLATAIQSTANGLSMGGYNLLVGALGDDAHKTEMLARAAENPRANLIGEGIGTLGNIALTGGMGSLGTGAKAASMIERGARAGGVALAFANETGRYAELAAEARRYAQLLQRGGQIIKNAVPLATQGAVTSALNYAGDQALHDKPIAPEDLLMSAAKGGAIAGGLGAVLGAAMPLRKMTALDFAADPGEVVSIGNRIWNQTGEILGSTSSVGSRIIPREADSVLSHVLGESHELQAASDLAEHDVTSQLDRLASSSEYKPPNVSGLVDTEDERLGSKLSADERAAFNERMEGISERYNPGETYVKGAENPAPASAWRGAFEEMKGLADQAGIARGLGQDKLATAYEEVSAGIRRELDNAAGKESKELGAALQTFEDARSAHLDALRGEQAIPSLRDQLTGFAGDKARAAAEHLGFDGDAAAELAMKKAGKYIDTGIDTVGKFAGGAIGHAIGGPVGGFVGYDVLGRAIKYGANKLLESNSINALNTLRGVADVSGKAARGLVEGAATVVPRMATMTVDQYDRVKNDIIQMKRDPSIAMTQIKATGFDQTHPQTSQDLYNAMINRNDYLASIVPQQLIKTTLEGQQALPPLPGEMHDFSLAYSAAMDPLGTLERAAKSGVMSPIEARTLQAVYPNRMQAVVNAARQMSQGAETSYEKRMTLSDLAGTPLDPTLEKPYSQLMETLSEDSGKQNAGPPSKQALNSDKEEKSMLTRTQKLDAE